MQQQSTLPQVVPVSNQAAVAHAADHAADAHHDAHVMHGDATALQSNTKFGMWLFLMSELFFFSVLIIGYIIARYAHPEEHALLNVPITSVNSFILLLSSFNVVWGLSGVQSGNLVRLQRGIAGVIILGLTFFVIMMLEFAELSHHGVTLNHPYGMAFFSLTGFHGIHVLIGIGWGIYVFNRAFKGVYTKENHWGVESWGLYWHFVDVIWIFIFTIVYLI